MLSTLARRAAAVSRPTIQAAPAFLAAHPTKKLWPPDFKRLTPQEQLRFEKKYKRRVRLASRRPKFDKAVKLAQLVTVVGTSSSWFPERRRVAHSCVAVFLVWGFLFSEFEFWGQAYKPSKEVSLGRNRLQDPLRNMLTTDVDRSESS